MNRRHGIGAPMVLTLALSVLSWNMLTPQRARAQDSSTPPAGGTSGGQTPDSGQQEGGAPAPAYGVSTGPAPVSENPPITGLDLPGLTQHGAPISYLQPGAMVTESLDTNAANTLGGSAVHSVTRALGTLELQRLWSNYALALDYAGGAGYYNIAGVHFKQVQQFVIDQRVTWKRGQLGVRDSFSYLPEGNFAGAYGSNAQGQALGSLGSGSAFLGGSNYGSLGEVPRIMNLTSVDVVQNLTPKSSVTATGGYSFVHYTGSGAGIDNISFLGSQQVSAQLGYDRILGPHDQVAISYGYQSFHFSVPGVSTAGLPNTLSSSFHTNVVQLMWGHRISGRMDFLVGAGPQITSINSEAQLCIFMGGVLNVLPQNCAMFLGELVTVPEISQRISVAGRASLRYRFPKTNLDLGYERFTTNGSGLLPGASSNLFHLSASRPLNRIWTVFADTGFSRNSRVLLGGGTTADIFDSAFGGVGVHRNLGRTLRAFASFQFNYLSFDTAACGATGTVCNRTSRRQVGTVGLDWTPRPIRID